MRPVEAELSHADRQTDRYGEAYRRFSHFANAPSKVRGSCCTFQPAVSEKSMEIRALEYPTK